MEELVSLELLLEGLMTRSVSSYLDGASAVDNVVGLLDLVVRGSRSVARHSDNWWLLRNWLN